MKAQSLILRVYGEQKNGQWSLICLEFNLAAQADSLPEAQAKLHDMVKSYLRDALAGGVDADFGSQFLRRRAPLSFWLKFYYLKFFCHNHHPHDPRHVARSDTLPMQLAGA